MSMRKVFKEERPDFVEDDIPNKNPTKLFQSWFKDAAQACATFEEANCGCVSTATKDGKPSARYLLLKEFDQDGFKFGTCYSSRKGDELAENPFAAVTFFWAKLMRQVRIEGMVEKLTAEESDALWEDRDQKGQAAHYYLDQKSPVPSKKYLVSKLVEAEAEFTDKGQPIPRPPTWGGYRLRPNYFEFWVGQRDRLHDRIIFRRPEQSEQLGECSHEGEDGWVYERIAP